MWVTFQILGFSFPPLLRNCFLCFTNKRGQFLIQNTLFLNTNHIKVWKHHMLTRNDNTSRLCYYCLCTIHYYLSYYINCNYSFLTVSLHHSHGSTTHEQPICLLVTVNWWTIYKNLISIQVHTWPKTSHINIIMLKKW
jgi:hypothetical protein